MNIVDLILIIANAFCLFLEAITDEEKTKLNKVGCVLNFVAIVLLAAVIFWRVKQ